MNKWTRAMYLPGLPLGEDGRRITASPAHIELSKKAAREGMVLLKNEHHTLPLERGTRIALFGKGTIDYVKGGGGSGDVTVPYVHSLADGLLSVAGADCIFPDTLSFYQKHIESEYAKGRMPGMTEEPPIPAELLDRAAAFADTAVISISRFSGEGWDRKADFDQTDAHKGVDERPIRLSDELFEKGDFYYSAAEQDMIRTVTARFSRVIVVLNVGGIVETASLQENPGIGAVLLAWQGGMEGGTAAAELLMGLYSPCGKLADTFARNLMDYPSSESFYASDDYVDYYEDIYVGYRYFETIPGAADKVVYPFGFGLSYTQFSICNTDVLCLDDEILAGATVTNTGLCPGREVVQVYFSAPQGKLGKPARQLAGYRKTRLLQPGESEQVLIRFKTASMASYDDLGYVQKSAWILEAGDYHFYIGSSIRDAKEADTVYSLLGNRIVAQLSPRMVPVSLSMRMRSDGSFEPLPKGTPTDPNETRLPPLTEAELDYLAPAVRAQAPVHFFAPPEIPQLKDVADGKITLDAFVAQLPEEDLCHLLGGQPNTGAANTFGYGNNKTYGIPNIMTADGPAGVRFWPETGLKTTAFPCATLLACTWDPQICYDIGRAGALEAKENNIGAWLTPAVCIHRSPLCGRNFEYFSEDPLLTGLQASALVKGIQSEHIAATPKHFALNNKESNRKESDSRVSERAIREIYLRQFEIIVKQSHPWSIMSSYNIINGQRASENADMLTGILRQEWGFQGMVTTDWWNDAEQYKEVAAGNDMKMGRGYPERLLDALHAGYISRQELENAAKHVLTLILNID